MYNQLYKMSMIALTIILMGALVIITLGMTKASFQSDIVEQAHDTVTENMHYIGEADNKIEEYKYAAEGLFYADVQREVTSE